MQMQNIKLSHKNVNTPYMSRNTANILDVLITEHWTTNVRTNVAKSLTKVDNNAAQHDLEAHPSYSRQKQDNCFFKSTSNSSNTPITTPAAAQPRRYTQLYDK
jgi:hypothetical protein